MASWKKVIVSGSAASLASVTLDSALGVASGGTALQSIGTNNFIVGTGTTSTATVGSNGTGTVVRTTGATGVVMSGSFSGSYIGDGSQLTGVGAGTMSVKGSTGGTGTFALTTDTLKFTTASADHGFSIDTTDATEFLVTLNTPQDLRTVGSPTFSNITAGAATFTALPTGSLNSVVTLNGTNALSARTIDARVWGSTLIDGAGANTRVAYFSDADTLTSAAAFAYDGTLLTVGTSTFGTNVFVAGDLTVLGNTFSVQVTNLNVEDRFILLNSGSVSGDGGFIVQTDADSSGSAFGWYDTSARWAVKQVAALGATAASFTPDAFASMVVDIDAGLADTATHQKNGNLKTSGSDIYIYS